MFDLSWVELGFVGALALLVIGPKDLPKMFKMINQVVTKAKRTINDVKGGFKQLENEIHIVEGTSPKSTDWKQLLPEDIRNLPEDFIPGTLPPEYHQKRRQQIIDKQNEMARMQADNVNDTEINKNSPQNIEKQEQVS